MRGILLSGLMAWSVSVFGSESQFGFIYTTDLLPKNAKEVEQWLTWRGQKTGGTFNLFEGKTAIEYGVTDAFQIAGYATYDWMEAYENGPDGKTAPAEPFSYSQPGETDYYSSTKFIGLSLEAIYRVMSPYTDPFGMAFYFEPTVGDRFTELEARIILQKNFFDDTLVLAFNFTYAPEFRYLPSDDGTSKSWQEETDVNFSYGASYRFTSNWSIGFELLNEHEANSYDWSMHMNNGWYLGPSLHFGGKDFFVTAVFLKQMPWATTYADTAPDAVVHGYDFDNDFEMYRIRVKTGFYF
jgi:hypothetical protein